MADAQHRSAEDVALDIFRAGLLGDLLDLNTAAADIRAAAPNPAALRPAQGSLLAALADDEEDDSFDLADWQRAWATVETEMAAMTRADDHAEGRP